MLRQILRTVDGKLLGGRIQKKRLEMRRQADVADLKDRSSHTFSVFYDRHDDSEMARLCDKYGSDKGSVTTRDHAYLWLPHTYTDFYSRMFAHCRRSVRKVFECGLGTNNPDVVSSMGVTGKPGASLRMWKDYFPEALVYGADIDKNIIFEEDRIKTFYVDQLDPDAIAEMWKSINERDFDMIVDDGLHTFEAGSTLFTHSINHLSDAGIYVIEDVLKSDLAKYKDFFDKTPYVVDYVTLFRPKVGLGDNSLVVIRKML